MVTRVPLGICYLVAHLKRNSHEVKVFDTTFYKCSDVQSDDKLREASLQVKNPDLNQYGLIGKETDVFEEFRKEIESFRPDLIGMSAADPNYQFGLEFLGFVKKYYPNIKTIVGGATPTVAPDEVIKEKCVDMLCIGEAEEAFPELCNKLDTHEDITHIANIWIKKGDTIYRNPIRDLQDLNEILAPDMSIFDYRHFMRPLGGKVYRMGTVMWTRGCAYHCKYCANSAFVNIYKGKGSFYRIKDPKIFVGELKKFKEDFNLNFLFFVDDIFPLHKPEILFEFCTLYREQVDVPFSINLHPLLIREEPLKQVVDAGCVNICVGLESGSYEIRSEILGRTYTDDQIIKVFKFAKDNGIRSSSFNMIGMPHETREDIMKTIELNKKAGPNSATLTYFHPYRGSALLDLCLKERLFDPSREDEEENIYRTESRLNMPQISKEELRGLFNTFQLYFKLPEQYYDMIKIVESGSEEGQKLMKDVLKPKFDELTKNEMIWDFLERRESWNKLN